VLCCVNRTPQKLSIENRKRRYSSGYLVEEDKEKIEEDTLRDREERYISKKSSRRDELTKFEPGRPLSGKYHSERRE